METQTLLKITSYNVRGILNPAKRTKSLGKMKKDKPGIIFFCRKLTSTQLEPVKLGRQGFKLISSTSFHGEGEG